MTAPAVTRALSVLYGSLELGGTTSYMITGLQVHRRGTYEAAVDVTVVVQEDTDAAFKASCAALEAALGLRDQAISVVMNGQTHPSYNPSANTGFLTRAEAVKVGTPSGDTGLSRVYHVTLSAQLPSPDSAGMKDLSVSVDYDAAKIRTVVIRGEWRADGASDATAAYFAGIEAVCSAALTAAAAGGTFERVAQTTDRERKDKILTFSRTYREIIFHQSSSALDDTSIVAPVFSIQDLQPQPGDSGKGIRRLREFAIRFACYLDKEVATNIDSLYTSKVRPFMRSEFISQKSPSSFGITQEEKTYLPHTNQLVAEMRILAAVGASSVVELLVTKRIVEDAGAVLTGAWTGKPFDKYLDFGHASRRRVTMTVKRVLGKAEPTSRAPAGAGSGGWVLIANDSSATERVIGQPDGDQLGVTDIVDTIVEEYRTQPSAGAPPPTTPDPGAPSPTPGGPPVTTPGPGPGDGGGGAPPTAPVGPTFPAPGGAGPGPGRGGPGEGYAPGYPPDNPGLGPY